ncbi:glutamate N-acetyltransferase [Agrilactobacillus composti DSM 18527 = JCM 14202]|nr:bifunctional glutamate N-acetyltransferase/amino-acid acetyltransferase ArgJ [Agrilactobacillus composti]GAF39854.1 glutamate N-acetyltransferase [Agrilactobacillus composti DSM 18527 = JCM 14202]
MGQNLPKGFQFFSDHVGIKADQKDLGIIVAENVCHAAAVFTKNKLCGVSIPIGQEKLHNNELQAIVVTSGIANVATGAQGSANAEAICAAVAEDLKIASQNVLPSATGVIGPQLPIAKILPKIHHISASLTSDYHDFVKAISTTDTKIKARSIKIGDATILAVGKGSGMIEPNMATMLVYMMTDANIEKSTLYAMLKEAVDQSFNVMSVDTDTSTSDTVVLMANGLAGAVAPGAFQNGLNEVTRALAEDIVSDAEGATKVIEVNVTGWQDSQQGKIIGKAVVNSPLVKTAINGADPNWGRLVMAIGKTQIVGLNFESLSLKFGDYLIFDHGNEYSKNLLNIEQYLKNNEKVSIYIDLGMAPAAETVSVLGCDLSKEYVEINSAYTS